ncbi:Protein kinase, catalytic domain-containing protein, partial [Cynara cardunculus var. scolymus]
MGHCCSKGAVKEDVNTGSIAGVNYQNERPSRKPPTPAGDTPVHSFTGSPWQIPFPEGVGATPSPAGTPRRSMLKWPFPPPSPAKPIMSAIRKRREIKKEKSKIPEEEGKETEISLDKTFGYSRNFRSRYELGKEVGRGHFGHTCVAKCKKGALKNQLCEGGELLDRILSKGGRYTETDAKSIVMQILSVASFIHLQGVVHRDLKPENFLFSTKDEASPMKADMWSIGVITYILLCGSRPFFARTESGIFRSVVRADPNLNCSPWPSVSPEAKDFSYVRATPLRRAALKALSKALTEDELIYLSAQFNHLEPKDGCVSLDNFKTMKPLSYTQMTFEEFSAAAISPHQLEALQGWEAIANTAFQIGYGAVMENSIFLDIRSFCMVCQFVVPTRDNNNNTANSSFLSCTIVLYVGRSSCPTVVGIYDDGYDDDGDDDDDDDADD